MISLLKWLGWWSLVFWIIWFGHVLFEISQERIEAKRKDLGL